MPVLENILKISLILLQGSMLASCDFFDGSNQDATDASDIIVIPDDYPTIQRGIDTANSGTLILVRPGSYFENINLQGKTITLASWFYITNDESYVERTILDGSGSTVITSASDSSGSEINGFTIRNGVDGISTSAVINISNNKFESNGDGIDYEGGGGDCYLNTFKDNRDDGVDLDGAVSVNIEGNRILNNGDDGIEIRLHPYSGTTLQVMIYNNTISGNSEDGIQIIDYDGLSDRRMIIKKNIIDHSDKSAIGMMANGNTIEDFSGAPVLEPILVYNNTLTNNSYGITGGANLIALNNLMLNTSFTAMRNISEQSYSSHNLFWNNGIDYENSVVDLDSTLFQDPLLDGNYMPMPNSPAIDSGTEQFVRDGEILIQVLSNEYSRIAPDIGAIEFQQ